MQILHTPRFGSTSRLGSANRQLRFSFSREVRSYFTGLLPLLGVLIALSASQSAQAADVTWSSVGNATAGGNGNWTGGTTWWTGSANQTWVNSDNATFSAAGNTTVNSDVTANKLTFTSGTANMSILNGAGNLTIAGGGIAASNSANTAALTYTISESSLILGANQTWTVNNGGTVGTTNLAVSGVVSGAFNLSKAGNGTLTLSGNNTYSGLTTVSAGTLTLSGNNTAATGGVTLTAGTLNINNARALGGTAGTFAINGGTIDNTTAAAITNANNNALTLGGNFTFTGTSDLNLGTGNVTIAAAANRQITVTNADATLTLGGNITSTTARVIKAGSGALVFSGTNAYTGNTTVSAGTLQFTKIAALGNGTSSYWTSANLLASSGATMAFNVGGAGEFSSGNMSTIKASTGIVSGARIGMDTTAGNFTYSGGNFSSGVGLTKLGVNTLTFGNATTGPVTINQGALAFTTDNTGVKALTFGSLDGSTNVGVLDLTSANLTATSLVVQTLSTGNNTIALGAGKTLNVNGNVTVNTTAINGTAGANLLFNPGGAVPTSSFTVTGANTFLVGQDYTTSTTTPTSLVDMRNLGTFNAGNSTTALTRFVVGYYTQAGGTNYYDAGTYSLYLAPNSTVYATDFSVGKRATGNPGQFTNTLYLGNGTTALHSTSITVGETGARGTAGSTVKWNTGVTGGNLTLNGTGANSTVANMYVGYKTDTASAVDRVGTVDLSNGTVTGNITNLYVGYKPGDDSGNGNPDTTGVFKIGAGAAGASSNLTIANLTLGYSGSTVASRNNPVDGTFQLDGGNVSVTNNIVLTNESLYDTRTGTLTINGGNMTVGGNITSGNTKATSVINLAGGKLDMTSGDIGTAANTVKGFNYSGGVLANPASIYTGAMTATNASADNATITLPASKVLSVTGAGGLIVGEDGNAVASNDKLTLTGAGSLAVLNASANVLIGVASTSTSVTGTAALDLSGLASATFGNSTTAINELRIGYGQQTVGNLTLSNTANTLNANIVVVGDSQGLNTGGAHSLLILGNGTNVIGADTLNIAMSKGFATVKFTSQTAGSPGTVTFTAQDGVSGGNITVGNTVMNTSAAVQGLLDLRGHIANVTAATVTLGNSTNNAAGPTGTLSFDAGTFTATTLKIGTQAAASGNFTSKGVLNIGGGNFTVGTITMATKTAAGTGNAAGDINVTGGNLTVNTAFTLASQSTNGTATGNLSITGGTVTSNVAILDGGGNSTTRITLNGGTLDMTGKAIGNATNSINTLEFQSGTLKNVAAINGTGGLTKTAAGTLTLAGTNTYTGLTTVSTGTLKLGAAGALGNGTTNTSGVTVSGTAIFDLGGITPTASTVPLILSSSANGFDVGAFTNSVSTAATYGGAVTLQANTRAGSNFGNITLTGAITGGGYNFIKDGSDNMTLSNSGTVSLGTLQIYRGTLQLNSGTALNPTGSFILGGGNSVGTSLILNGGNLTVASGQTATFGSGSGSASSTLTLTSGTLTVPKLTKGSQAYTIAFNGGTLKANGASSTFLSSNAAITAKVQSGGAFIDDGGYAITISQNLTEDSGSTGGGLTKSGSGTLTLSGTNTYGGATTVGGGTLAIDGSGSINPTTGAALTVQGNGVFQYGSSAASNFGSLSVGTGANNAGNFTQTAGTITVSSILTQSGLSGSNTAVFNLSGGALTSSGQISFSSRGGPVTGAGSTTVNISGTATLNANGGLRIGNSQAYSAGATINQTGGIVNIVGGLNLAKVPTNANTTTGIYNLDGGTLSTNAIIQDATSGTSVTSGTFNFNGGTLKPTGNSTTFMEGLTIANVKDGGAKIDTTGFDITIAQPLVHDSGLGTQDGGLTKSGAGTLTLAGANTYNGSTTVSAGTLAVNGTLAATSAINVTGGSLLVGANQAITNPVAVSMNGTLGFTSASANATNQTLGALTLTANSIIDFGNSAYHSLTFSGIDLASFTLSVWNWNGTAVTGGGASQLIASGGLTGSPSNVSFYSGINGSGFLGTGMMAGNEIVAIPEPGTILAGALLLGGLLFFERKRIWKS